MNKQIINQVQAAGYDVYMRSPESTYLYFTDGHYIGFLQHTREGIGLSTVHKANRHTGTGFPILRHADSFTADDLKACFTPPAWTTAADRAAATPYADVEAFLSDSPWNSSLQKVPAQVLVDA